MFYSKPCSLVKSFVLVLVVLVIGALFSFPSLALADAADYNNRANCTDHDYYWYDGTETCYETENDKLSAQVSRLLDRIDSLTATINELSSEKGEKEKEEWCYNFEKPLGFGDQGVQVEYLHTALEKEGFNVSSSEKSNSMFGRTTASAVTKFQEEYHQATLAPWNLRSGTGYVGKTTRRKLNEIYNCKKQQEAEKEEKEELIMKVKNAAPEKAYSDLTWGATFIIENPSETTREVTYNLTPSSSNTSGAVVVDPDGDGPEEDFYYNFGDNVSIGPKKKQRLSVSLSPPVKAGSFPVKITFKESGREDPFSVYETSIEAVSSTTKSASVTSPNGGEQWTVGTEHEINWTTTGFDLAESSIQIGLRNTAYSSENPKQEMTIAESTPNDGSYNWTIPSTIEAGTSYKIVIYVKGTEVIDLSEDTFQISGTCHTSELWSWDYCSSECPCGIGEGDCDKDDHCTTGHCAQNVGDEYGQSSSMDVCEEKEKSITVTSPNGGERFSQGDSYNIRWESSGDIGRVEIYTCMTEDSYEEINLSETRCSTEVTTDNDGFYSDDFGEAAITGNYIVRIEDASDSSIYDKSDDPYSIASGDCHTSELWSQDYCSSECPCEAGEGNCTSDNDCTALSLYCAYNVGDEYGQAPSLNVCQEQDRTCTDSDGGGKRYEKGTIYGRHWSTEDGVTRTKSWEDYCESDSKVMEYYCDEDESINAGRRSYACYYGCEDGVCQPGITVNSPDGGEQWEFGKSYNISWESRGLTEVTVYLWYPDGAMCKLAENIDSQEGENQYSVALQENQQCPNIPSNITGGEYKISIWGGGPGVPEDISAPHDASDDYLTISKANEKPIADFDYSPAEAAVGETIQFNSQSSDSDGSISRYEWDFGSFGITGDQVGYAYDSAGAHTVTLTVTDDEGAEDSISKSVSVGQEYISVKSPNGGELWEKGEIHDITWESKNVNNIDVKLEYWAGMAGGPETWILKRNVSASAGNYSWTVGEHNNEYSTDIYKGDEYKIAIVDASNDDIADRSDEKFTIEEVNALGGAGELQVQLASLEEAVSDLTKRIKEMLEE